jgi:hypothetical protein
MGVCVLGALTLGACGSTTSSSSSTTSSTTTSLAATVQNLTVTPAIKTALLVAGAKGHNLPVKDFTGLRVGKTFYAYDPASGLYWAGAQLVPSPASMPAQVSVQDDGAYNLFTRTVSGSWIAYNDGLGTVPGSSCAIVTPHAVRVVWGWSTTTPCGGPPA